MRSILSLVMVSFILLQNSMSVEAFSGEQFPTFVLCPVQIIDRWNLPRILLNHFDLQDGKYCKSSIVYPFVAMIITCILKPIWTLLIPLV